MKIHPSDNPGTLIAFEIFTSDNYVARNQFIFIALTIKNKIVFINGSLPQPNLDNTRLSVA